MSDHSNEVMVISDDDDGSSDGAGAAEGSPIHPVPELVVGEDHPAPEPELAGPVQIHPVPEEIEVIEIDSDDSNFNSIPDGGSDHSSSVQIVHPVPQIEVQAHPVPQIQFHLVYPVPQMEAEAHPVQDQEIQLIILIDSDSDNDQGHGQHDVVANNDVVEELPVPALPASPAAVEALPEAPVNEDEALSACAVCSEVFAAGELAVWLPCNHYFHGDCIRPWLAIRGTCPVCRGQLPRNDDAGGADQGAAAAP